MARWVRTELGPDVPHHFSAFHPDHRMRDVPPTPPATLTRARLLAQDEGLHYVYTGNVRDLDGDATRCPGCAATLIARDRYEILDFRLGPGGTCPQCGHTVPGRFERLPGDFGRRRLPVHIAPQGSGPPRPEP